MRKANVLAVNHVQVHALRVVALRAGLVQLLSCQFAGQGLRLPLALENGHNFSEYGTNGFHFVGFLCGVTGELRGEREEPVIIALK